ncbi:hypothetical protein [Desulfosporosinus hippei]|uniref:hypothetical protein n=1 Tax=Desulfosporosinus hippei TaxID=569859 RepID=UPI00115FBEB4|nr:hypothetical protein [Desulfosporosinus hippei]
MIGFNGLMTIHSLPALTAAIAGKSSPTIKGTAAAAGVPTCCGNIQQSGESGQDLLHFLSKNK